MKIPVSVFVMLMVLCIIPCMASGPAISVPPVIVDPPGNLTPHTVVTVSFTVNCTGVFPSGEELQLFAELNDPHWNYTIVVNGMENVRPVAGGSTLTISGFELSYRPSDTVSLQVILEGLAPPVTRTTNKTMIRITEYDYQGIPVAGSQVEKTALVMHQVNMNPAVQVGVFRNTTSTWYLDFRRIGVVDKTFSFGKPGDVPVTGDWNGDGSADAGVFRPSNGNWYLNYNKDGVTDELFHLGKTGDVAYVLIAGRPVFEFTGCTNILVSDATSVEDLEAHGIDRPEELWIPRGIARYDLVSFNHSILNTEIRSGEGVPVRIRGNEYSINLARMNFENISDGIDSYLGTVEEVPYSEVLFTTSQNTIHGRVTLTQETFWITPVENRTRTENSPSPLHIVYSTNDITTGQNSTSDGLPDVP